MLPSLFTQKVFAKNPLTCSDGSKQELCGPNWSNGGPVKTGGPGFCFKRPANDNRPDYCPNGSHLMHGGFLNLQTFEGDCPTADTDCCEPTSSDQNDANGCFNSSVTGASHNKVCSTTKKTVTLCGPNWQSGKLSATGNKNDTTTTGTGFCQGGYGTCPGNTAELQNFDVNECSGAPDEITYASNYKCCVPKDPTEITNNVCLKPANQANQHQLSCSGSGVTVSLCGSGVKDGADMTTPNVGMCSPNTDHTCPSGSKAITDPNIGLNCPFPMFGTSTSNTVCCAANTPADIDPASKCLKSVATQKNTNIVCNNVAIPLCGLHRGDAGVSKTGTEGPGECTQASSCPTNAHHIAFAVTDCSGLTGTQECCAPNATSEIDANGCIVPDHSGAPTYAPIPPPPSPPCAAGFDSTKGTCTGIVSALSDPNNPGKFLSTDPSQFIAQILQILIGIAGAIALLLIMFSGYRLITSQGKPEAVQAAREQLTAAIVGLIFLLCSLVIIQVITVDLLVIPGFRGDNGTNTGTSTGGTGTSTGTGNTTTNMTCQQQYGANAYCASSTRRGSCIGTIDSNPNLCPGGSECCYATKQQTACAGACVTTAANSCPVATDVHDQQGDFDCISKNNHNTNTICCVPQAANGNQCGGCSAHQACTLEGQYCQSSPPDASGTYTVFQCQKTTTGTIEWNALYPQTGNPCTP